MNEAAALMRFSSKKMQWAFCRENQSACKTTWPYDRIPQHLIPDTSKFKPTGANQNKRWQSIHM